MKNTAHFGLTANGNLINLGVGAETKEVANLLADNAEGVLQVNIMVLLDINDLYRLRGEFTEALNSLDNQALASEPETFGTE